MKSKSFRSIFILGLIIFIAVFISFGIIIETYKYNTRKTSLDGLMNISESYSLLFDDWLKNEVNMIKTYSSLLLVKNYLALNTHENETIKQLKMFKEFNKYAVHIGIANTNGVALLDTDSVNIIGKAIKNVHLEAWKILSDSKFDYAYAPEVSKSLVSGDISLFLASGVNDGNGNTLGIVFETLDMTKFINDYLANVKIGKDSKIFVIDENSNIVLDKNKELIGSKFQYSSENDGVKYYTDNGIKYTSVFKKLKMQPWILVISVDNSFLVNNTLNNIYILICIFTAIIVVLVIVFYVKISKYHKNK